MRMPPVRADGDVMRADIVSDPERLFILFPCATAHQTRERATGRCEHVGESLAGIVWQCECEHQQCPGTMIGEPGCGRTIGVDRSMLSNLRRTHRACPDRSARLQPGIMRDPVTVRTKRETQLHRAVWYRSPATDLVSGESGDSPQRLALCVSRRPTFGRLRHTGRKLQ